MMLNADLTVGVTVKLIGKRTDSTIGEILLTRTDVDRIRFVHSDCAEGKLCLFNANTEEFVIHVHNTSLVIEVQGAPENSTDTFLFEIQYKDETGVNQVLYVTVQGNGYAVIAGDLSNNVVYTIKLLTDWSWQYRCNAVTIPDGSLAIETAQSTDQISVKLQNTERNSNQTNHVIFHVTMEGTNWLEDEAREDNNFGVFYPDKA
jgi:glycogen debranching enzyme